MATRSIPTPRCGSEITEAWLEHMLTSYEQRRDPQAVVMVTNFYVRPGTKPGENVASELIKIWAEVKLTRWKDDTVDGKRDTPATKKEKEKEEDNKGGKEEKENGSINNANTITRETNANSSRKEYHLVAKFNQGSEFDIEYVKQLNMDLNELLIYSDVISHLNTWQEQVLREKGKDGEALDRYKLLVPEFVYGVCTYNDYVLVMQDVSVLGYTTEDKMQGLDLPHALMAVERLARLHAVSHAFHKTNNFLKHYPTLEVDDRLYAFFASFMFVIINFSVELASQRPEFAPIVEKMRDNEEAMKTRLLEIFKSDNPKNRIKCLSHGDYWINNLMFSHEGTGVEGEAKVPQDLMLIDWGLVTWRNPIFDVHQLVYNCTTLSLRRQHLQDILQMYHSTFTAATTDLGAPVAGYTFEEFMKEWRRTAIFGFTQSGLFANSIVLSRKAMEGFKKGSQSSGLKSVALRMLGKIMVPLVLNGWFRNAIINSTKKNFQPVLEEMLSGENPVLNCRLLELMEEAYQEGVLDG